MKTLKNYIYNSLYQVLNTLLPLVTAPYISRVLHPEGVGINTMASSLAAYFLIFGQLGLVMYGNREVAYTRENDEDRSKAFWNVFITRFLTISLSMIAFICTIEIMDIPNKDIYMLYSLTFLSSILDVTWYFMGVENFKVIAIRGILLKISSIFLIFTFVRVPSDLWIYVSILMGGALLANVSLVAMLKNEVRLPSKKNLEIKKTLIHSLPIFLPGIATSVYLILNKLMIGWIDSTQSAGFFQQSDSIIKIIVNLTTSLSSVLLPRIANNFRNNDKTETIKLLKVSTSISTSIAVGATFGILGIANVFIPLFFGELFTPSIPILRVESIMIVINTWNAIIGWQFLMPIQKTNILTTSVVIGAITNFILNFPLIIIWGPTGAAVASVFSEISTFVYMFLRTKSILNYKELFEGTFTYILSGILMFNIIIFMPISSDFAPILELLIKVLMGIFTYIMLLILLKSPVTESLRGMVNGFLKQKK
jgi:O-antigen/teichoic acid export membrane protein